MFQNKLKRVVVHHGRARASGARASRARASGARARG